MKFDVDALHAFSSYAPDKKGTDGLTDGRVEYYMPPLGVIKIMFDRTFLLCSFLKHCYKNYIHLDENVKGSNFSYFYLPLI